MRAAHNARRRVPQQLAVIGIDDTQFARVFSPALTSVSLGAYGRGQQAARLLLDRMDGAASHLRAPSASNPVWWCGSPVPRPATGSAHDRARRGRRVGQHGRRGPYLAAAQAGRDVAGARDPAQRRRQGRQPGRRRRPGRGCRHRDGRRGRHGRRRRRAARRPPRGRHRRHRGPPPRPTTPPAWPSSPSTTGAENTIVVAAGANAAVELSDADRAAVGTADVVLAQLEIPQAVVAEAARRRRAGALLRPQRGAGRRPDPVLLAEIDVLVVNEHEAVEIAGAGRRGGGGATALSRRFPRCSSRSARRAPGW